MLQVAGGARSYRLKLGAAAAALLFHCFLFIFSFVHAARQVATGAVGVREAAGTAEGEMRDVVNVSLEHWPAHRRLASAVPSPTQPIRLASRIDASEIRSLVVKPPPEPSEAPPTINTSNTSPSETPAEQKSCDIAGAVQARLQADPEVRIAVSGWPEASGLFAPPRVLWDGQWTDSELLGGGDTIAPIRRVIASVTQASPAECGSSPIFGLLAFYVTLPAGVTRTSTKVDFIIGSERWNWVDLIGPPAPLPPVAS